MLCLSQDDFWKLFINMWTISLSILSQTVFHIFPGKNPQSFYLCLGTVPLTFKEQKVKVNWPSFALALTSLAVHLSIGLRTHFFNRKFNQVTMSEISSRSRFS
jgi:CRISPR/Cas system endoribonuclease Cas6 (RAMP superfamily)